MAKTDKTDKEEGRAFSVRLTSIELKILDDLRRKEPAPPSRGKMIKLLIERAAAAKEKF
jgi:hypothetical protein